ncbi:hypothetical protein CDAR_181571 [Caerostris darwini]|uniref:Mitotic checkpoint serine/threonine-protein kinase BUB1 beta n=1 Tax=Caerostris darwini TaxID=1538125 RepID=A0AAV4U446_9ARAC|nr:hypothetical protein CDAR_181571 [Caerostris darwini]
MATSNEEWEYAKENIQPLQQGRKPGVLKVALSTCPEDLIQVERQAFEAELRTYTGNDPLSVWYKYIKWVEQNFPKGGKDGHLEQLIQQCLSLMKDKSEYFDDKRFIEIWLKFAKMAEKPTDVYEYMYTYKIGCKSALFFVEWSWELENQGNTKRADEVLIEGIHRKAQPVEKLKLVHSEFEMRVASKVMTNSEQNNNGEPCRSAFSILKHSQKNKVPVLRTGDSVIDPSRISRTIGQQQSQPKKSTPSAKVPFKVYNAENIAPSLPVQSENAVPHVLNSNFSKENDKKPSKWNKVKVKQTPLINTATDPAFKLHCDEATLQSVTTPRSMPKDSNVLRARQDSFAPPLAIFEPADPLKKPMYDKEKVYCGAEEFSFEEIRGAAWFKKKHLIKKEEKIAEQDRKLYEQQEQINRLRRELELLKNKQSATPETGSPVKNKCIDKLSSKVNPIQFLSPDIQDDVSDTKNQDLTSLPVQRELFPTSKLTSTFKEASYIVRDFYNDTIFQPPENSTNHEENPGQPKQIVSNDKNFYECSESISNCPKTMIERNVDTGQHPQIISRKPTLSFDLFQDPADFIPQPEKSAEPLLHSKQIPDNNLKEIHKEDIENMPPKDYVPELSKRELNGILQPSKNIMFTPLEQQESEYASDEDEHCVYRENNNHPIENETMIPPCNTEQFAAAVFMVSTPRTQFKKDCNPDLLHENDNTTKFDQPIRNCNPAIQQSSSMEDITCNRQLSKTDFRNQSTIRGYTGQLSVIMESSREYCKSSSSSGSSVNTTKSSHLEQYYSQEKSSIQKYISRIDTCKEPQLANQGPDCLHSVDEGEATFKERKVATQKISLAITEKEASSKESKSESNEDAFKKPLAKSFRDISHKEDKILHEKEEKFELYSTDIDPFDAKFSTKVLQSSDASDNFYSNLQVSQKDIKHIEINKEIEFGTLNCLVKGIISEGAYGKVYEAQVKCAPNNSNYLNNNHKVAVKVCKHSNNWELYICNTTHKRLQELNKFPDVRMSIMEIMSAHQYSNALVLISEFSHQGTLLNLVNFYTHQKICIPETISMYLTWEMLHIMSQIHACQIIHGDIKPDNILLRDIILNVDLESLFEKTIVLKFIDFGRAIDLSVFKPGVCFKTVLKEACNEMKENKPWAFQIDWYGFLNCIHVLLFSDYMKVKKNVNGKWTIEKKFKRYWDQSIWVPLFDDLLNIPSCYQEPDILKYTNLIECKLKANVQTFQFQFHRLMSSYKNEMTSKKTF